MKFEKEKGETLYHFTFTEQEAEELMLMAMATTSTPSDVDVAVFDALFGEFAGYSTRYAYKGDFTIERIN